MLQDVMQKHGLGVVDETDAYRILDAVRERNEAMRLAAEETRERENGYEAAKVRRKESLAESAPENANTGTATQTAQQNPEGATWTYTRRGIGSTALTDVRTMGFKRSL